MWLSSVKLREGVRNQGDLCRRTWKAKVIDEGISLSVMETSQRALSTEMSQSHFLKKISTGPMTGLSGYHVVLARMTDAVCSGLDDSSAGGKRRMTLESAVKQTWQGQIQGGGCRKGRASR